jgi:hypothetical protein
VFCHSRSTVSCRAAILFLAFLLGLYPGFSFGQTERVLYSFGPGSGFASGQLVFDSAGTLYGTTSESLYDGSVYQLTPPTIAGGAWTEAVIYEFKGDNHGIVDGAVPLGGVTMDSTGALYGTTSKGGNGGRGSVFMVRPPSLLAARGRKPSFILSVETQMAKLPPPAYSG